MIITSTVCFLPAIPGLKNQTSTVESGKDYLRVRRPSAFTGLMLLLIVGSVLSGCSLHNKRVSVNAAGNKLNGVLIMPKRVAGPAPVLIFVHGDGPANADYYGYYQPFWRALAERGIASFSWDKPGVGNSNGNWLDQNMNDRAVEVVAAANVLASRPEIDAAHIGVIGFSQAGWVLPRLAGEKWLDYLIFVSTAINWRDQGDYLFRRRWASRIHSDPDGYQDAIERNKRFDDLYQETDAGYDQYLELMMQIDGGSPKSALRFAFEKRNMYEDASQNLAKIRVPVLALFGEDDLNVDVDASLTEYKHVFNIPPKVDHTLRAFPNATHQLTKSTISNRQVPNLWSALVINVLGKNVFVDGVLDELTDFVEKQLALL